MFHFWRNSLVLNCLILNKDNSKPVNYVVMKPGEKCNLRSVFKELQGWKPWVKRGCIALESSEISAMILFWKERTLLWKGTMKTRSKLNIAELLGTLKNLGKHCRKKKWTLKCGSNFPRDKGCEEIWETETLQGTGAFSRAPHFNHFSRATSITANWTQTCKTLEGRKVWAKSSVQPNWSSSTQPADKHLKICKKSENTILMSLFRGTC